MRTSQIIASIVVLAFGASPAIAASAQKPLCGQSSSVISCSDALAACNLITQIADADGGIGNGSQLRLAASGSAIVIANNVPRGGPDAQQLQQDCLTLQSACCPTGVTGMNGKGSITFDGVSDNNNVQIVNQSDL